MIQRLRAIREDKKRHLLALLLVAADACALLACVIVAHFLRFDHLSWQVIYSDHIRTHLVSLPLALGLYLTCFAVFRLYRCAWRYAGMEMLWGVICANTIGILGLIMLQRALDGSTFARSVFVIMWVGSIVMVGGLRLSLRVASIARKNGRLALRSFGVRHNRKRAVIVGAGNCGVRTLRAIRYDSSLQYDIVGFMDDDPAKQGIYISNVKVLGPPSLVKELARKRAVDEVIIAVQEVGRDGVHDCVMECKRLKIPVKVVPHLRNVLNGSKTTELADFSVEDLLRRKPVDTAVADIGGYLAGSRVLVTGAGGSIGSELCRQIASHNPASLVLLGHGENSIHRIHQELIHSFPQMSEKFRSVIASTANQARISQVFRHHRPQVVFHAAAHKHVPMMETNEQEAVINNILGTHNIAAASGESGVERIVLVSTDKAADPCCMMGATKWMCEQVFRSAASLWTGTSYMTVRFGNVLGSRGSVVPLFREQIRRGGPVLVTHPEMTRYFMTIPEAVRLLLEAGAVGKSGELYLLDMGNQVKILDLANDMIRLSGLEPGVDVNIEFTGIRPGEKMHESLTSTTETVEQTPWAGLSIVHRQHCLSHDELLDAINTLRHASESEGDASLRKTLSSLVGDGCDQVRLEQAGYVQSTR
ncbi:MAG: polysaccharide biosynthesis protein [Armatimonadota bacterium]